IKGMFSGEGLLKDVMAISERFSKVKKIDMTDGINSQKAEMMKQEINEYLATQDGHYGVFYYNIFTNETFGINETEEFVAASTVKVPLNLYLYKKIKDGSVNPEAILTYTKDDFEGGTGIIQRQNIGKKYTIKKLSELSITHSDNIATNMLIRYLGMKNVKAYMREIGGSVVEDGKNISCPKDLGLYMRVVHNMYETEGELGNQLMNNLLNTQFKDRIQELLPEDIKVAHKIGTQVKVINDVGLVFAEQPYILAVMSKDVDENVAPGVIADISKKIFDSLNSGYEEEKTND
ncbi:MAG TPA: class A beta-lactamase-related serine hydrolase, partial [bacterium]|nr:class A beta-lactamase-related serine hydrolase [bacterium]